MEKKRMARRQGEPGASPERREEGERDGDFSRAGAAVAGLDWLAGWLWAVAGHSFNRTRARDAVRVPRSLPPPRARRPPVDGGPDGRGPGARQ